MIIKKTKCPICNGVAYVSLDQGDILTECKSKKDCNYVNRRPYK